MQAVKTLILDEPPILHASSDYTLLRGALENFAVVFWVLNPPDQRMRIEWSLRCATQDFEDQDKAIKDP